jgi:exopolysaccharide biosynthesis polyprenyl glycosylphosphotransferase
MYTGDRLVVDGGSAAPQDLTDLQAAGGSQASTSLPDAVNTVQSDDAAVISGVETLSPDMGTTDSVAQWTTSFLDSYPSATPRDGWQRRFVIQLIAVDFVAATIAVLGAFMVRFLLPNIRGGYGNEGAVYTAFVILLPLAWITVIALNRAYQPRIVGVGSIEFQRVFRASIHLGSLIAVAAYASHVVVARGFVLVVLPLALGLDLIGRYAARKHLHRERSRTGRFMMSVVAVGGTQSVADFTELLRRDRYAGMRVIGACVPNAAEMDASSAQVLDELGVPVLGDVDSVLDAVRFSGAHTVAVLSGEISADKLRWISWQLEGTDTDLVVSPGLTEVAGPRLHIQPVAGLPMLYVEEPEFNGFRRILKGAFDRCAAAVLLLVLSPVLIALGVAVRFGSRGPAFFRQVRVGLDGSTFTMIKFRSMYANAEARLADLQAHNENADGLLFKIKDDPRVTRIGKVLRRYSLDEFPQLINVLKGDMSLVGPRPPLPAEVEQYGTDVRRRLLVKPGMTGMWQISGRSDLPWDESVRLDLRYVENWSLATDLFILFKTIGAVVRSSGAY